MRSPARESTISAFTHGGVGGVNTVCVLLVLSLCGPRRPLVRLSVEPPVKEDILPEYAYVSGWFDGHENWRHILKDALAPPASDLVINVPRFVSSRRSEGHPDTNFPPSVAVVGDHWCGPAETASAFALSATVCRRRVWVVEHWNDADCYKMITEVSEPPFIVFLDPTPSQRKESARPAVDSWFDSYVDDGRLAIEAIRQTRSTSVGKGSSS